MSKPSTGFLCMEIRLLCSCIYLLLDILFSLILCFFVSFYLYLLKVSLFLHLLCIRVLPFVSVYFGFSVCLNFCILCFLSCFLSCYFFVCWFAGQRVPTWLHTACLYFMLLSSKWVSNLSIYERNNRGETYKGDIGGLKKITWMTKFH